MIRNLARNTVLACAVLFAPAAQAADKIASPLGLVIPYGPGGATDYQARIVTMLSGRKTMLGQPFYIKNMIGGGGRKAWNWMARQAPTDGTMMATYNIPHILAQSINGGVRFAPDDFIPLANWGADPAVVVVPAHSTFTTMKELLAHVRRHPGQVTTSGAGMFTGHHIAALQIQRACDCHLAYMPTRTGGAAAMRAVASGEVMAGINNLSDAFRAQRIGKVRVLAVADVKRHAYLPDVPTLREAGLDVDDASVNYRGIMVRAGTPAPEVERLKAALPAMFTHPIITARMKMSGSPMHVLSAADTRELWRARQAVLEELLSGM